MLIEFGQESFNLEKSDEFLGLRGNLTLTEPEYGHWGPEQSPKVGSIWGYFLDSSLNLKLDPSSVHTNPIMDPESPSQTQGRYVVGIISPPHLVWKGLRVCKIAPFLLRSLDERIKTVLDQITNLIARDLG